jgi:hypothetical protein
MNTRIIRPRQPRQRPGAWLAATATLGVVTAVLLAVTPQPPQAEKQVRFDHAAALPAPGTFTGVVIQDGVTARSLPAFPKQGRVHPDLTLPEYGEPIPAGTQLTFECYYNAGPVPDMWFRLHQPEQRRTPESVHLVLPTAWTRVMEGAVPAQCPDDDVTVHDTPATRAEADQCANNPYVCVIARFSREFAGQNDHLVTGDDRHGDNRTDAVRHCLMQLYITAFADPASANAWGDAHEHEPGSLISHDMDLHNNQVARDLVADAELQRVMADRPFGTGHMTSSQPRQRIRDLCAQKGATARQVSPDAKPWPATELIFFDPDPR